MVIFLYNLYIFGKWLFFYLIYTFLRSIYKLSYNENCVIMNSVIKRTECILKPRKWQHLLYGYITVLSNIM